MTEEIATRTPQEFVDVRELHPDYREMECWNCGATEWVGPNRELRVCHECFMDNSPTEHDGDSVVEGPDGELYLDYRLVWYGDIPIDEAKRRYERETEDIENRMRRSRARERSVKV